MEHRQAIYYKADGTEVGPLPAGGDWPEIYGRQGLSLSCPAGGPWGPNSGRMVDRPDEMLTPEEIDERRREAMLEATRQGEDSEQPEPEPEAQPDPEPEAPTEEPTPEEPDTGSTDAAVEEGI